DLVAIELPVFARTNVAAGERRPVGCEHPERDPAAAVRREERDGDAHQAEADRPRPERPAAAVRLVPLRHGVALPRGGSPGARRRASPARGGAPAARASPFVPSPSPGRTRGRARDTRRGTPTDRTRPRARRRADARARAPSPPADARP